MQALQHVCFAIASRLFPPLSDLLNSAGGTIERLSEHIRSLRELNQEARERRITEAAELAEAAAMVGPTPWLAPAKILESEHRVSKSLRESAGTGELELALEDRGWRRLISSSATEFSRWGIQQIIAISRLYWIKNPLIRRGVEVSCHYVFGRGVDVNSPDEATNDVLREFFGDPRNQAELGHNALVQKEGDCYRDGNLFFALFSSPDGRTVVRTIDSLEIEEIVTDPQDSSAPWYYHRRWTEERLNTASGVVEQKPRDAWYAALEYTGDVPVTIGRADIMRDNSGQPVRVLHRKVGGLPKWKFGCPMVYPALDWARAYRENMESWISKERALRILAWQVKTEGGAPAIAAWQQKLKTALGATQTVETNPAPAAGSAAVTGKGTEIDPIKTSGLQTSLDQSRRVLLMVCAAFGLPETFFGDASVGALATAESLDRPTELMCLGRQEFWRETLQLMARYVIAVRAGSADGKFREALRETKTTSETVVVNVSFPDILDHDVLKRIAAIVQSMTLGQSGEVGGIDEKTGVGLLMEELGIEDWQAKLDAMYPEATYVVDRTKVEEPPPAPPVVPVAPVARIDRQTEALESATRRLEELVSAQ